MLLSINDVCGTWHSRAASLAQKDPLAGKLLLGGLARIEPAGRIQLRGRREIDDVLHLRHHRDLVGAIGEDEPLCASR